MQVPRELDAWARTHAKERGNDMVCRTTGAVLKCYEVGRSVHTEPLGGSGEVRKIAHPFCPECSPNYLPPDWGTPIQLSDLVGSDGPI